MIWQSSADTAPAVCRRPGRPHQLRGWALGAAVLKLTFNSSVSPLDASDPWLVQCPVDIDIHAAQAVALDELGRVTETQHQLRWRDGLIDSVLRSGDGRTPETAWIVISVSEEYSILRSFGMRLRKQALTNDRLDKMEVERDGETHTLYFNPESHFRRLDGRY